MANMLIAPVSCSSKLRTGYTPHWSGNDVASNHKANMPPKNMAKVSLMFLMVMVHDKVDLKRPAPFTGKIV